MPETFTVIRSNLKYNKRAEIKYYFPPNARISLSRGFSKKTKKKKESAFADLSGERAPKLSIFSVQCGKVHSRFAYLDAQQMLQTLSLAAI